MIGLRRTLSLAALCVLSLSLSAQSAQDLFRQGVEQLDQGHDQEALALFQRVLAADPSHEQAWELWRDTDERVWMRLMEKEGEFEQIAKRLMMLADMGQKERRNDPDAIRDLLKKLDTNDIAARTQVIQTLGSDYGEYAVPLMVYGLADQADEDRRIILMQALTQMGPDVVPPLIEALDSEDAFLRRNVALTLGYIGDGRANGVLALHARTDQDEGVRAAAAQALQRTGGGKDALKELLAEGDAYHNQLDSVLRPYQYSDVVWTWEGKGLVSAEVPRFLYPDEMAKKCYYRALQLAPDSLEGLAGVARVSVSERQHVMEWAKAGQDVGDWDQRLAADELAVRVAGGAALDLALGWALDQDDQAAASGLCRALAQAASKPTKNLQRALGASSSGKVQGEAAVALGWIASSSSSTASGDVVSVLSKLASQELVRIAAIVDGNDATRNALQQALTKEGVLVNAWPTGGRALASLRAIPGVDVLVVAEKLPDLTAQQVVAEVRDDPRYAKTPVVLVAADPDAAKDVWGDQVTAIAKAGDPAPVLEALAQDLTGDRAEANELAARAATVLANLAAGGTDVSSGADALASALADRPDEVTVPALGALAHAGASRNVEAIAAVLTDGGRSEAVRVAAAKALSGVFARAPQASDAVVAGLTQVATSDASFDVREATATALGRLPLPAPARVKLMGSVRSKLAQ